MFALMALTAVLMWSAVNSGPWLVRLSLFNVCINRLNHFAQYGLLLMRSIIALPILTVSILALIALIASECIQLVTCCAAPSISATDVCI
jgi:hypothetical protein